MQLRREGCESRAGGEQRLGGSPSKGGVYLSIPYVQRSSATEEHVFTGCHPLQLQLCSEIDLAVLENASLVGLEEVQARPTRLLVFLWCRRVGVAEVEVERLAESLNAWDATTAAHNAERLDRIATQPQVDGFWTQASEVMMPIRLS